MPPKVLRDVEMAMKWCSPCDCMCLTFSEGHCRARKQYAGCPEVEWLPTHCLRESLGRWKRSITWLWRWLHHCVHFSKLIKLYTYWLLLYLHYTIIKHISLFFNVMGAQEKRRCVLIHLQPWYSTWQSYTWKKAMAHLTNYPCRDPK